MDIEHKDQIKTVTLSVSLFLFAKTLTMPSTHFIYGYMASDIW